MRRISSSMDDQQERHFIGNLLLDEEVLAQGNTRTNESGTGNNAPASNVLPSSGPFGPTLNRNFWPEPPPPYSPCTAGGVSQWNTISHQPAQSLMPQIQPGPTPYGQALTATAVTRTDFYQSPYNRNANWDTLCTSAVDPYVTPSVPYPPLGTVSVLKPLIGSTGPIEGMHHHYQTMYHHHQQHLVPSQVDPRMFTSTQPSTVYSARDAAHLMNVQQYPSSNEVQKLPNDPLQLKEIHQNELHGREPACILPSPGKSYRDVASKRGRSSPSLTPSSIRTVCNASIGTGNKETARSNAKKANAIPRSNYNRGNNKVSTPANPQKSSSISTSLVKSSDATIKKTNIECKTVGENEFQKIAPKRSKAVKTNKCELLTVDEDGFTGSHLVDASSRFEVLQSLGVQGVIADPSKNLLSRRQIPSTDSLKDTEKNRKSADLPVVKKFIRRELSAQSVAEQVRGGRKQRGSAKKRHNIISDRITFIATLIFSFIKYCVGWFADLLMDISLQLWDITVYSTLSASASITYNCQYYWYFLIGKMRSFRDAIRLFKTKRLRSNQNVEPDGWGLTENIQLPTTGEEAIERILQCHGRDAYVVLGLNANCSDDDIKRYYRRQAILVHPDKAHQKCNLQNCLCGTDEAFKLLTRAFDAIGTPESRNEYNIANLHMNPLHKEMEGLWQRLRKKVDEARNSMYCDCGNKHTRIVVAGLRPPEARYCQKCNARHSAKHNDIWAETRFAGFFWTYYACLDGVIYDITQWASCPSNQLKHIKANSHTVQYRLVTATGPFGSKGGSSTSKQQDRNGCNSSDNSHCFGGEMRAGACEHTDRGSCSMPLGYDSLVASQQAAYRPPDINPFNDRPKRAGRRRKMR